MPGAVGGVEDVQRDEGSRRRQQAEDHRGHLQQRRAAAVPGVDGRGEAEAGRRRTGQIGEHAHDLWPEVVPAFLTAQWLAGMLGRRALLESHEFADHPVGVRGEYQLPAVWAQHLTKRRGDDRDVAHDQHQIFVDTLQQ